jgi:hypothetical protein
MARRAAAEAASPLAPHFHEYLTPFFSFSTPHSASPMQVSSDLAASSFAALSLAASPVSLASGLPHLKPFPQN